MQPTPSRSLVVRLVWFVGLWLASVLAVALVAYGLRIWLV
jgi:hypothetical protein|nr:DUF2474 domain-containing protein [Aminobacter sp. MSH1]